MYYIEDQRIIIMRQAEIYNPKYKHIEKIIDTHPCMEIHESYGNILIFKILKTYEGKNKICSDIGYLNIEMLCLCSLEIMCENDIVCISTSDLTHYEQLQKIRAKYRKLGFDIPKIISFPKYMEEYGDRTYSIIPLLFDHSLGFISEFTDEEIEFEEEYEEEEPV